MQTKFHLWLARIISHEENALAILNGPALKWAAVLAALVIALPNLANIPVISVIWICLVLIGIDVQYIACVVRAAESSGWVRFWWIVVTVLLFVPVVQTNAVFSLHGQTGISELDAMSVIRLTPTVWALERAFLLALLMAVSALSRPRQQHMALIPVPADPPAAPPPSGKRRRDIGRTVEQTEALKAKVRPQIIKLARGGMSQDDIAARLKITKFMVREIINESGVRPVKVRRVS